MAVFPISGRAALAQIARYEAAFTQAAAAATTRLASGRSVTSAAQNPVAITTEISMRAQQSATGIYLRQSQQAASTAGSVAAGLTSASAVLTQLRAAVAGLDSANPASVSATQAKVAALTAELNRIAGTATTATGQRLLDGSLASNPLSFRVAATGTTADIVSLSPLSVAAAALGTAGVKLGDIDFGRVAVPATPGTPAIPAQPGNMVTNSSAATDLSGWTLNTSSNVTMTRVTGQTVPDGGTTAAEITSTGANNLTLSISLNSPNTKIVAGQQYTVSAWVRDVNTNYVTTAMKVVNTSGSTPVTYSGIYPTTNPDKGWHQISMTFTADRNGSADTVARIEFQGNATFKLQFAGFQMTDPSGGGIPAVPSTPGTPAVAPATTQSDALAAIDAAQATLSSQIAAATAVTTAMTIRTDAISRQASQSVTALDRLVNVNTAMESALLARDQIRASSAASLFAQTKSLHAAIVSQLLSASGLR